MTGSAPEIAVRSKAAVCTRGSESSITIEFPLAMVNEKASSEGVIVEDPQHLRGPEKAQKFLEMVSVIPHIYVAKVLPTEAVGYRCDRRW